MDEELLEALYRLVGAAWHRSGRQEPWETFAARAEEALDTGGAPMRLRAAVASVPGEEDQLRVLRQFTPLAEPIQKGRFLYWDPERNVPVLFDEEGISLRDVTADAVGFFGELAGGMAGAVGGGGMAGPAGAITGAGVGAAAGREAAGEVTRRMTGAEDPRTLRDYGRDVATTSLLNAGGQAAGMGLAARLGGDRAAAAAAREAAERQGVPLTAGQARGSRTLRFLEEGAARRSMSASTFDDFVTRQYDQIRALSDDVRQMLTPDIPPPDKAEASLRLREAFRRIGDDFKAQREVLEMALQDAVGPQTRTPIPHTQEALQALQQSIQNAPGTGQKVHKETLDWLTVLAKDAEANGGWVPFQSLRQARSRVGELMEGADIAGRSRSGLSNVYRLLSQDLEGAVAMAGEEAQRAWRLHNRYVRFARSNRRQINLDKLTRIVGRDADMAAYDWAVQGAEDSPRRLWALRQSLQPDEWSAVSSAVWDDLGRQRTTGEWSPATFITSWEKLHQGSKEALFRGTRYRDAVQAIDDLVKIAGSTRNSAKLANHSNTASALLAASIYGGVGGALVGGMGTAGTGVLAGAGALAGAEGVSWAAAKLFTNPRFVRAITVGVQTLDHSPNSLPAVLGRITAAVADEDPDVRAWVQQNIVNKLGPLATNLGR